MCVEQIKRVSNTLKWNDVERFCRERGYEIKRSKKGYKISVGSSVCCVHLEHRTSDKLKFGIIKQFKKVLEKENQI